VNAVPIVVAIEPLTVDMATACAMLGVSSRTLNRLMTEGKLNARKLERRTVFTVEDIKAFVAKLPSWEPQS
jgi:hypothetical protein